MLKCEHCGKRIWGLSRVDFTKGIETPILLHANCYELLQQYAMLYKKEVEKSLEGIL